MAPSSQVKEPPGKPGRFNDCLAGGEAARATKPAYGRDLENRRLEAELGELMLERERLAEKIAALAAVDPRCGSPPLARGRSRPWAGRSRPRPAAPTALVARVWGVARATIYRQCQPAAAPHRRPGPQGPMPDAGSVEALRRVLAGSGFAGESYRKVGARLRFIGIRTSRRRVLRLRREQALLAHRRSGAAPRATTARSPPSGSISCGRRIRPRS